jgi:hypothetical protein
MALGIRRIAYCPCEHGSTVDAALQCPRTTIGYVTGVQYGNYLLQKSLWFYLGRQACPGLLGPTPDCWRLRVGTGEGEDKALAHRWSSTKVTRSPEVIADTFSIGLGYPREHNRCLALGCSARTSVSCLQEQKHSTQVDLPQRRTP